MKRPLILSCALAALICAGCGSTASNPNGKSAGGHTAAPRTAQYVALHRAHRARLARTHHASPPHLQTAHRAHAPGVRAPHIVWDPIAFGAVRKAQTVAYTRRHYHSFMKPTWRLVRPHVIVIHYTAASYGATYNTFASDVPDSELHELPATSAHFVIDESGTIHQLVSVGTIARHTVGLNWTAIGIEHVGFSDGQVLGNPRQMSASLHLGHWLRCRFHIPVADVIGHAESLSSPYHHEDVPRLRTQTHSDFQHADMEVYRRRLRALGGC